MTSESWSLIFDGVQAGAVVIALTFGVYELSDIRRRRYWESLDKMLQEWRSQLSAHQEVLKRMPLHDGSVEVRALELAKLFVAVGRSGSASDQEELAKTLCSARDVVHGLNDLGAFVERGTVNQLDFFGHFHIRITELVFLLEPFIVLVSACRESRWGLRLRRLRIGAERYHYAYHVHRALNVKVRGRIVIEGATEPDTLLPWVRDLQLRRRLIPTKEECKDEEDQLMAAVRLMVRAPLAESGLSIEEFCTNLPVDV